MIEYNLTFLEACEALDKNRCERIENKFGHQYKVINGILGYVLCDNEIDKAIRLSPKDFLNKWRLIDEKPRTEERTFKYWMVIWNDGTRPTIYYDSPSQNVREVAQIIAFCEAYIYTYPIC